jgi:hypothetical protein
VNSLKETVIAVMSGYAVKGLNGFSVLTMSADQSILTVVSTAVVKGKRMMTVSLIARIDGDHVYIDHDINNKPLVDALIEAGIPQNKITLTYTGEPVSVTK